MAQVELDKKLVEQAQQLVVVAESNVQMAIAQLAEAKANVGKFQAEVVRWESEVQTSDPDGARRRSSTSKCSTRRRSNSIRARPRETPPKPRWPRGKRIE